MSEVSAIDFFRMGGIIMWPLLFCSIIASTIFFQKIFFLSSLFKTIAGVEVALLGDLRGHQVIKALSRMDAHASVPSRIFKAGLLKYAMSRNEIMDAMEDAAKREFFLLEQGMGFFSTLVFVFPLLGFLGTLLGLYEAFHDALMHAQAFNPTLSILVLSAIRRSLISTLSGIFLGILALILYNFLVNYIYQVVRKIENTAVSLADALTAPVDFTANR